MGVNRYDSASIRFSVALAAVCCRHVSLLSSKFALNLSCFLGIHVYNELGDGSHWANVLFVVQICESGTYDTGSG